MIFESSSVQSSSFKATLFDPTPIDARYLSTAFHEFFPINSLTGGSGQVQFELPGKTLLLKKTSSYF